MKYIYTLTAYNSSGEASGQCEATIPGPSAAPTNFHAHAPMTTSSTTLELTWTDNANNEDGFWITRRPSYQGNYPNTPTIKLGATVTKYTIQAWNRKQLTITSSHLSGPVTSLRRRRKPVLRQILIHPRISKLQPYLHRK